MKKIIDFLGHFLLDKSLRHDLSLQPGQPVVVFFCHGAGQRQMVPINLVVLRCEVDLPVLVLTSLQKSGLQDTLLNFRVPQRKVAPCSMLFKPCLINFTWIGTVLQVVFKLVYLIENQLVFL